MKLPCAMATTEGINPLKPSPMRYEFRYISLKIAINGKKRTELVQSTNDKKNTRTNSHVLCSTPPILVVSLQYTDNRKDDVVPINRSREMQRLSDIWNM